MSAASIILAIALFAFVIWLEVNERNEPKAGDEDSTFDDSYLRARHRGRRTVNLLLTITGGFILVAGLVGPGPTWIAMWLAVCGLLVVVLMLGMHDMVRTNRYLAKKLPEIREKTIDRFGTRSDESSGGSNVPQVNED